MLADTKVSFKLEFKEMSEFTTVVPSLTIVAHFTKPYSKRPYTLARSLQWVYSRIYWKENSTDKQIMLHAMASVKQQVEIFGVNDFVYHPNKFELLCNSLRNLFQFFFPGLLWLLLPFQNLDFRYTVLVMPCITINFSVP